MDIRRVVSSAIFGAVIVCFFLPFGTASCEGQTSTFTGIELVTLSVDDRPDVDGVYGNPDFDLATEVEKRASALAIFMFAAAVGGLVSTSLRWRPGLALLAAITGIVFAAIMLAIGVNS